MNPFIVREPFTLAWQHNVTLPNDRQTLLTSSAVFCCITGIAGDISKMPLNLVEKDSDGIWNEVTSSNALAPYKVLSDPNHFQTRLQFVEQWNVSKLLYGNSYALKERDNRGVVVRLYLLHPLCVETLVAEDGSIFYKLKRDYLAQVSDEMADVAIPASEIIHDRMVGFFHPLAGLPPLFACASSATLQAKIQNNSTAFFSNRQLPGGILSAEGAISDETAARLKSTWETNFGGANSGRVAVLGDGLKFQQMMMSAEHAQLIDQLKYTVEDVGRAFHYPLFKLTGIYPPYDSIEAIEIIYYKDCLQVLIEQFESSLNKGLGLDGVTRSVQLDIDALWRMDTNTMFEQLDKAKNILTLNEQRFRANFGPVKGGNTVYKQEQDHSVVWLAERDAQGPPPVNPQQSTPPSNVATPTPMPMQPDNERSFDAEDLEVFEGELVLR